jgi:hypothetical protein
MVHNVPSLEYDDSFQGTLYPGRPVDHLMTDFTEVESASLAKLYEKLDSVKTELSGLVVLGEMRETLKMIRHPMDTFRKQTESYFEALRKRKSSVSKMPVKYRKPEWNKIITGTYLEFVFGAVPTYNDIIAGVKVLERYRNGDPLRKRISAEHTLSSSTEVIDGPFKSTTGIVMVFRKEDFITTEIGSKFIIGLQVQEEIANSSLDRVLALSGFKLDEFTPSLYELMPWSWLIDYFSNLGDLINAGTTDTSSVLWVVRDRRQKTTLTSSPSAVDPTPHYIGSYVINHWSGSFGNSATTRTTLVREPLDDIPMPTFQVTHPGDNVKKLLNMLAVANSLRAGYRELSWLTRRGA